MSGARLTLRLRLPNPPAAFVGRAAEHAALEAAIRRGPVSVVWGLAGLGKTALVLHTLRTAFSARFSRAIYLPLHAGDPPAQMRLEIARAVTEARGLVVEWPALAQDPGDLDATLLDLAESSRAWVFLDDLHHGDPAWVRELLGRLARYARSSRWIVATRVDPDAPDLAGQLVSLGPLAKSELADLAARWEPAAKVSALGEAVDRAGGSPWRLKRILAGERPADEALSILAALPKGAAPILEILWVARVPLPSSAMPMPDVADVSSALERRGLVERTPMGLVLHDVARTALELDPARAREVAARLAEALVSSGNAALEVEGLRLLFFAGATDAAVDLVSRRGADLLAAGYAPRLWRSVESERDPRLAGFRLRCAVELGDREALAKVDPPEGAPPADRLTWARSHLLRADLDAAERAARELLGADDPAIAFEAGILLARTLGNRGEYRKMREVLDALVPTDDDGAARCDMLVARCLADLGEWQTAIAFADELVARLPLMKAVTRDAVRVAVSVTYFRAGQLRRALAVWTGATEGPESSQLYIRRQALSLRAGLEIDSGSLDGAREHLARLQPFVQGTLHRHFVAGLAAELRLVAGELTGLDAALAEVMAETRAHGLTYNHWQARALALRLGILQNVPEAAPDEPPPDIPAAPYVALHRLQARIRRGEGLGAGEPPVHELPELAILANVVRAQDSIVRADPAAALAALATAIESAKSTGYRVREAEARAARCEALATAGRIEDLATEARALVALGRAFPSALVEAEGKFFEAVAQAVVDPAGLEALAAKEDVAPIAARRARALLGTRTSLDALDRAVVEAVRRGWTIARLDGTPADVWQPGWGLDEVRKDVWLPGGRLARFSDRPLLWRLLETIALSGGAASKESLAERVWGEREYHPLRHDGRMHAAMHKIRRDVEDDPASPVRVVTTEDGYAFGTAEPVRLLRITGGPTSPR